MKNKDKLQEIINLRLDGYTYAEIGKLYGVSRQCIQQFIDPPKGIVLEVSKRANYKCEICGINLKHGGHLHHKTNGDYDYSSADNMMLVCASCHRRIHCIDNNPDLLIPRYCKYCGLVITHYNKKFDYCSIGCKVKDNSVTLTCYNCGKSFVLTLTKFDQTKKNKKHFCSKSCFGSWTGKNFGKYNLHHKPPKHDWSRAIELKKSGRTLREISEELNIPYNTCKVSIYRYINKSL
jgi:hypothetical protein